MFFFLSTWFSWWFCSCNSRDNSLFDRIIVSSYLIHTLIRVFYRSAPYGKPVDVWAIGCILGELSDGQVSVLLMCSIWKASGCVGWVIGCITLAFLYIKFIHEQATVELFVLCELVTIVYFSVSTASLSWREWDCSAFYNSEGGCARRYGICLNMSINA